MSTTRQRVPSGPVASASEVIWHDLECGGYRADLGLWRELADCHAGEVLEIGAGTGRVSLELARAGHTVTALDRDPALLAALRERPGGDKVRVACADACRFRLQAGSFALCLVPLHTLQLFGGRAGRAAFLRRARSALAPGGLLACAILGRVQPFSSRAGDLAPTDTALIDGVLYTSTTTRVTLGARRVTIERERRTAPASAAATPATLQTDVVRLDRMTARGLAREAAAAGLRKVETVKLAATQDHSGSTVVMLAV
jgi:SAM-dependent methyltransferase